jgi:hypothetical protein
MPTKTKVPKGRRGPGIPVPKTEKYPGLYRLQTAWFMATGREHELFLEWVKKQQERKSCNAARPLVVDVRAAARAEARANRKCATCGQPIKAQRSTMKFCSVRCRVAAYRAE